MHADICHLESILDMNPEDVYVRYPHQPHWTSDAPPLQMNFSNSLSEDSYGQQQVSRNAERLLKGQ